VRGRDGFLDGFDWHLAHATALERICSQSLSGPLQQSQHTGWQLRSGASLRTLSLSLFFLLHRHTLCRRRAPRPLLAHAPKGIVAAAAADLISIAALELWHVVALLSQLTVAPGDGRDVHLAHLLSRDHSASDEPAVRGYYWCGLW
jgi:hypothetical protein